MNDFECRTITIGLKQQQHEQELNNLHRQGQLSANPQRKKMARLLHLLADLLDGRARIAVVYPEAMDPS